MARSDVFRYKIDFSPVKVAKKLSIGEGLAMLVALVTPGAKLKVRYIAERRKCNATVNSATRFRVVNPLSTSGEKKRRTVKGVMLLLFEI